MAPESEPTKRQEAYMHDYEGAPTGQVIAGRRAETHAAFFLPHLRAGMSLLDCGCGPGSITVGLARAVAPGQVTGIDLAASQVAAARENAAAQGLGNVNFERCDVYRLPYADSSFDADFSHAMLEHLQDPVTVLREMHRVLKPGGLAGLRCIDLGGTLISPADEPLIKGHEIWGRYRRHCGGDPFMGRRLRALLREAGFAETVGTASSETWGRPDLTRAVVPALVDEFTGPKIAETAIRMGWATPAEMEAAARALEAWGDHADAFLVIAWCEVVGRKA